MPREPAPAPSRGPRLRRLLPALALGLVLLAFARARLAEEPAAPGILAAFPDMQLEPLAPPPTGVTVRGSVRSAQGAPVSQALVLAHAGHAPVWDFTGERGEFELTGLVAGPVLLRVSALRFEVEDFLIEAPSEGRRLVLTNELGLPPSLPALERETLVGEVVPSRPDWIVTGYEVVLVPAEPDALGAPVPRRTPVRSDRGFRFEELILGSYEVLVLPPWASGGSWPNLVRPAARELFHARTGAAPRASLPLEAGRIEATVRSATGSPLEGALVLVHPEGEPARLWPPLASDAAGAARVRDLPPGKYLLTVTVGEAELERAVSVQAGEALRVDLVF